MTKKEKQLIHPDDFLNIEHYKNKRMEKCKRIGIALALFYGWSSVLLTLSLAILYGIPIPILNMYALAVALPFFIYPFWWMGVSFIMGMIFMYYYMTRIR